MAVRLQDAVCIAEKGGEPLHLPGTVVCPALQAWCWEDGQQRMCNLAGHADVEVSLCLSCPSSLALAQLPACHSVRLMSERMAKLAQTAVANRSTLQVMISSSSRFKGDFQNRTLQAMRLGTLLKEWQVSAGATILLHT